MQHDRIVATATTAHDNACGLATGPAEFSAAMEAASLLMAFHLAEHADWLTKQAEAWRRCAERGHAPGWQRWT